MFKKTTGFTLIELIVVVVLLAIVSLYAASRFIGKSSFSVYTAKEQTISVIRQVQLRRMQSNTDTSSNYTQLSISSSCIGSVYACSLTAGSERSDALWLDDASVQSNVSQVSFDLLGNPTGSAASGVTISFSSGSETTTLCINSAGYVGSICT